MLGCWSELLSEACFRIHSSREIGCGLEDPASEPSELFDKLRSYPIDGIVEGRQAVELVGEAANDRHLRANAGRMARAGQGGRWCRGHGQVAAHAGAPEVEQAPSHRIRERVGNFGLRFA